MSASQPLKNYYAILGISETASLFEIENAYEKLAAKWHPDNHKQHRKSAETKFHEIAEAYEVLSDRNKRVQYDQLLMKQYSFEDANQTFERFFNEEGIFDEDEEKFFNEHFPNPLNNAYRVLGVNKKATFEDIKAAYRKLALKYHPKANAGNQEAHNKFVEVNQAYNAICDEVRRQNYDNLIFGEMVPVRAHSIFDDFFGDRFMSVENELKPIFHNKWSKDLDSLMVNEKDENCKEGETIKTSSVWNSNNGKETGKTVTTKKVIKDGKATQETTEEYTYPTGDKKILKTIKSGDRVQSREFNLKKGQDLPKELTN